MALSPLPPTSDFITTGETKGTFKGALSGLRAFLNSLLGSTGAQADALTGLGALLNGTVSKTATYKVVATDRGKLIDCSGGPWTLDVDAVAALGSGFAFAVRNNTAGAITINPNLSETIDGVATIDLAQGESCFVLCNGSALETVSRAVSLPAATASVDGYMTSTYAAKLDGIATGATVGVSKDAGAAGIGVMSLMWVSGSPIASNATVAGSGLAYPYGNGPNQLAVGVGATGTWRNVSSSTSNGWCTFQRIA